MIKNNQGRPMLCDIRYLKNLNTAPQIKKPIILFSHGFKGFKDFGCFNLIANEIASKGYIFLKFNYSMNGTSVEHPTEFVNLEAFSENTFTQELNDLGDLINYVCNTNFNLQHPINLDGIYLMGHSMGGGISILKAAEDNRIKKIITLASIFQFGRFWNDEMLHNWKENGIRFEYNSRTKQQMPLKYLIYEDYIQNIQRLHIPNAVRKINIPFCLIHGEKDETIPVQIVHEFISHKQDIDYQIIKDANHTFGMTHPWLSSKLPLDCEKLLEKVVPFLSIKT